MRILVVEDNLMNQLVAEELLIRQGASVYLAANGQMGVDAVAAAKPQFDVVLMDLQMPVMDGFDATRAIRQKLGLAKLCVIAMSANAMASDREASLAAGMNDHVGKPFEIAQLVELLLRHTGHKAVVETTVQPRDQDTKSTEVQRWSEVIDVEGALTWMGDDLQMYRRFLTSFLDDVRGNADQLQAHFERDERDDAARVLHTLKGLSRTVGALALSEFAADAESRLKRELTKEDLHALVVQTREQIASATQAILDVARTIDSTMNFPD
jgi:CheY-like chemotaxis protein